MSNYSNGSMIFFSQVGLISSFAVDQQHYFRVYLRPHFLLIFTLFFADRQTDEIKKPLINTKNMVVAQRLFLSVDTRHLAAVDQHLKFWRLSTKKNFCR